MATGSSKRRPAHNQPESKAGSPRAFQQVIRKAARFGCRNLQQACAAGSLAGPVGPMCTLLFFLVLIGIAGRTTRALCTHPLRLSPAGAMVRGP